MRKNKAGATTGCSRTKWGSVAPNVGQTFSEVLLLLDQSGGVCAVRLKIFLLYFAPQFSVYTKFGIDPKTAGSSTLDADLGVRVSFAASKCLAISTE